MNHLYVFFFLQIKSIFYFEYLKMNNRRYSQRIGTFIYDGMTEGGAFVDYIKLLVFTYDSLQLQQQITYVLTNDVKNSAILSHDRANKKIPVPA